MENEIVITTEECPAFCPHKKMAVWSGHPRVFLDLTHGHARCPYCGTAYRLSNLAQVNTDTQHFKHDD